MVNAGWIKTQSPSEKMPRREKKQEKKKNIEWGVWIALICVLILSFLLNTTAIDWGQTGSVSWTSDSIEGRITAVYMPQLFKMWTHKYPRGHFLLNAAFFRLAICLLFGKTLLNKTKYTPLIILLIFSIVASAEMWPVGTRTWINTAEVSERRICLDMKTIYNASFRAKRASFKGSIMLGPAYNTGIIPNWYFERYATFLDKFEKESQERAWLLGCMDARKIFFSTSLQHDTIRSFLQDILRFKQSGRLISYDGDNMIWQIEAPRDGYLSFIDNWDPYWEVSVDNHEEPIQLLFETFKAVRLKKGSHRIHFMYKPSLKAGFSALFNGVKSEEKDREASHE